MQEYIIDENYRNKVVEILIFLAVIIAGLIRYSVNGDFLNSILSQLFGDEMKKIIDLLGVVPNFLSVPFWYYVLWSLFDKYLWKCKLIQRFHNVPYIEGIWKGELKSSYDLSKTYNMQLEIKQTWSHIHFTAIFDKSSSESNIAAILSNETGDPVIYFGFQNRSRDRNAHEQIYDGYNRIELKGDTMYGSYSNNRPSNEQGKSDGNCGNFKLSKIESQTRK